MRSTAGCWPCCRGHGRADRGSSSQRNLLAAVHDLTKAASLGTLRNAHMLLRRQQACAELCVLPGGSRGSCLSGTACTAMPLSAMQGTLELLAGLSFGTGCTLCTETLQESAYVLTFLVGPCIAMGSLEHRAHLRLP